MSSGRRPKWSKSGEAQKGRTAFAESEGLEPRREQAKHDNYQRPSLEQAFPSRGLASERDREILPPPQGGGRRPPPTASPAKRVAVGEEEQRNERAFPVWGPQKLVYRFWGEEEQGNAMGKPRRGVPMKWTLLRRSEGYGACSDEGPSRH